MKQPRSDYYCYALFRENGQPFYIGKGRDQRWLMHEYRAVRGGTHKDNIICSMRDRGIAVPKCKLMENLTGAEALQIEIDLIALIGRIPKGPLVNRTAGGDGVNDPSPESRAKMSAARKGRKLTDDHKSNIAISLVGRKASEVARAKRSATLTGRKHSIQHRLNMSLARKGRPSTRTQYKATDETKAKISAAKLGQKASLETRMKMSAMRKGRVPWIKGRPMPAEAIAKTAAANRGRKLSAEHRAAITSANNRRWAIYRERNSSHERPNKADNE